MSISLKGAGAELYFKCMWLLSIGLYILIPMEYCATFIFPAPHSYYRETIGSLEPGCLNSNAWIIYLQLNFFYWYVIQFNEKSFAG